MSTPDSLRDTLIQQIRPQQTPLQPIGARRAELSARLQPLMTVSARCTLPRFTPEERQALVGLLTPVVRARLMAWAEALRDDPLLQEAAGDVNVTWEQLLAIVDQDAALDGLIQASGQLAQAAAQGLRQVTGELHEHNRRVQQAATEEQSDPQTPRRRRDQLAADWAPVQRTEMQAEARRAARSQRHARKAQKVQAAVAETRRPVEIRRAEETIAAAPPAQTPRTPTPGRSRK